MKIKESKLREAIRKIVEQKILKEEEEMIQKPSATQHGAEHLNHFMAARTLKIAAEQAALDFEKQIVKEMGIQDPNAMDATSQRLYHQVMQKMHRSVANSVILAVQELSSLPKNEPVSAPPKAG